MELFFINHIMKRLLLILTGMAVLASCCKKAETFSVIPQPNDVTFLKGSVCVKGAAVEIDPSIDKASREAIGRFVNALETATGVKCKADGDGFDFKYNPNLGPEQYYIEIEDDDVEVEASALNGFIYACETLKQMLPAAIYGGKKAGKASWVLPCVKIFDEPSSALDPIAEFELFKNIMKEGKDHTMLFISHRLSSVKNCDRVLMLEGGRLIEEGTHKELIALGGSYCEMYKRQAMNYLAIENEEEVIL